MLGTAARTQDLEGYSKRVRGALRCRPIVANRGHDGPMDNQAVKRHLEDVESNLRCAKRSCDSGSELERYIKGAISALDDAMRLVR